MAGKLSGKQKMKGSTPPGGMVYGINQIFLPAILADG
jgi:hypothetical protein